MRGALQEISNGDRLGQRRQLLLERENPLVLDLVGVFGCELRAEQGGEPNRLFGQSVVAKQRQRGDVLGDQLGLNATERGLKGSSSAMSRTGASATPINVRER